MKITIALALLALTSTTAQAQTPTTWTTPTSGSLSGSSVTVTGMPDAFIRFATFMTGDYSGAPLPANQGLDHRANSQWTATFSPPVPGLIWYAQNLRGFSGSLAGGPTDYTFSEPFEILSGFAQATIVGNTLVLPPNQFHNGIIRFLGPVGTLVCSTTCTEPNRQHCQLGQLDLNLGAAYCPPSVVNSTGQPTELEAKGSDLVADNFARLVGTALPPFTTGLFLASRSQGFVSMPAGSQGNLCLGGQIGRFTLPGQIQAADAAGTIELPLDLTAIPTPTSFDPVLAGDKWNFQLWHRDIVQGVQASNFSNGLAVTFR